MEWISIDPKGRIILGLYLHTLRIQKVANRYRMQVLVSVDRSVTEDTLFRILCTQNLLILLTKSPELGFEVCMFLKGEDCQNINTTITNIWPARNELIFLVLIYSNLEFLCANSIGEKDRLTSCLERGIFWSFSVWKAALASPARPADARMRADFMIRTDRIRVAQ